MVHLHRLTFAARCGGERDASSAHSAHSTHHHKSNYRSHLAAVFHSIVAKFVTLSALTIQTTVSVTLDGPAPFYVYDLKKYWYYYASLIPVGTLIIVTLFFVFAAPKPPPTRLPLIPSVIYE